MGIAPNQDYQPIKKNNENLLLLNRNTLVDWGHKFIINNNSISISLKIKIKWKKTYKLDIRKNKKKEQNKRKIGRDINYRIFHGSNK